ncbi:MAG: hypothetical protein ACJAWC_002049 [Yoonia sp.]|jgi:hypothetical protein
MKMSLFEYKMTELDCEVLAATAANNDLVMQRLRRVTGTIEPKPGAKSPFFEGDDLLFDNVPV